ncbi:hypothetical protein BY996DRAFT_6461259 [Phakopsora pachyrhizi]|uniref:Tet-like 2OG-Fe(II) oxygenase domain-containing protein n=1 Tax=Phakopsora pachyrhizi TaxID=170000 RepID=A0AAV0BTD4_PHAPC|nr:hypothetical protein BY996DRAFT_6461259 [Phakopsora pachyrhizi]CAH7689482.1 hypothetical protein PPACK8108_LOCUS24567 [Phakopsora pachyrhizi]
MVLAGSFKYVADGWFHISMREFNEKGPTAFFATLMNNNPPEAFSSALTFTTSEFKNTPHIDNDSSYIAEGWWIKVNKKTGEVNMDENKEVENIKIDFSKGNRICQIIWKVNKFYNSNLRSMDTKTDTRLGMSIQLGILTLCDPVAGNESLALA